MAWNTPFDVLEQSGSGLWLIEIILLHHRIVRTTALCFRALMSTNFVLPAWRDKKQTFVIDSLFIAFSPFLRHRLKRVSIGFR